jgi:hypothetical protein
VSSTVNIVPLPSSDPIAQVKRKEFIENEENDPLEGKVTQPWIDYFTANGQSLSNTTTLLNSATLTAQTASIGATDLAGGGLTAGFYMLMYYARITRAAGINSSLTVTLDWTDAGQACAFSGAAMVLNVVTQFQSGIQVFPSDNVSPIRYSTTYATAGAPTMEYKIVVKLFRVSL